MNQGVFAKMFGENLWRLINIADNAEDKSKIQVLIVSESSVKQFWLSDYECCAMTLILPFENPDNQSEKFAFIRPNGASFELWVGSFKPINSDPIKNGYQIDFANMVFTSKDEILSCSPLKTTSGDDLILLAIKTNGRSSIYQIDLDGKNFQLLFK